MNMPILMKYDHELIHISKKFEGNEQNEALDLLSKAISSDTYSSGIAKYGDLPLKLKVVCCWSKRFLNKVRVFW